MSIKQLINEYKTIIKEYVTGQSEAESNEVFARSMAVFDKVIQYPCADNEELYQKVEFFLSPEAGDFAPIPTQHPDEMKIEDRFMWELRRDVNRLRPEFSERKAA